jgi:hypothetical protein
VTSSPSNAKASGWRFLLQAPDGNAGETRSITNTGATRFEFVEFERSDAPCVMPASREPEIRAFPDAFATRCASLGGNDKAAE